MCRMISVSRPFSLVSVVILRPPRQRLRSRRSGRRRPRRCRAALRRAAAPPPRAHRACRSPHRRRGGCGIRGGVRSRVRGGRWRRRMPRVSLIEHARRSAAARSSGGNGMRKSAEVVRIQMSACVPPTSRRAADVLEHAAAEAGHARSSRSSTLIGATKHDMRDCMMHSAVLRDQPTLHRRRRIVMHKTSPASAQLAVRHAILDCERS